MRILSHLKDISIAHNCHMTITPRIRTMPGLVALLLGLASCNSSTPLATPAAAPGAPAAVAESDTAAAEFNRVRQLEAGCCDGTP